MNSLRVEDDPRLRGLTSLRKTTTKKEKQMKKLLLIALMVSGLAFNGEARDFCRQTAQDILTSCRNAAQSDYSLALAKCDNVADPAARVQCQSQASADLNDAQQTLPGTKRRAAGSLRPAWRSTVRP